MICSRPFICVISHTQFFSFRCPTYTQIPPLCSLQTVPGDCCKKVVCQPHTATLPPGYSQVTPPAVTPSTAPSGNCTDRISNCQQYGQSICSNTAYQSWAKRNCQAFCRIGCRKYSRIFILPLFDYNTVLHIPY